MSQTPGDETPTKTTPTKPSRTNTDINDVGEMNDDQADEPTVPQLNYLDKLTPKQIADFQEAFSLFDCNNDNEITVDEIAKVFQSIGHDNVTKEQLQDIMSEFDVDNSGTIDFNEFLCMMQAKMFDNEVNNTELNEEEKQKQLQKQVHAAFKLFDADSNGKIDVNELFHAMNQLGETVTLEEATEMLKEADLDGDGFIDEKEFQETIFQL